MFNFKVGITGAKKPGRPIVRTKRIALIIEKVEKYIWQLLSHVLTLLNLSSALIPFGSKILQWSWSLPCQFLINTL